MDEVKAKHETVVITKHGKPVAKLVPIIQRKTKSIISLVARESLLVRSFHLHFPPKSGASSRDPRRYACRHMAGIWARPHLQEGKDRNRRCPQGCGRLGGLRHHPVRAGDSHEQGLGPSRHQSRISFLQEVESRFVVLPITGRVCARAIGLPPSYPKDPADRIIGATALVEGLSLLTADREIRKSKILRTIW